MKIPDELLSAFLNGELEGPERQRVELAIARDRRVAQRVARQRALRSGFDEALDDVLRARHRRDPRRARKLTPGTAQIIDLARVRAQRAQIKRHRRALRSPRFMLVACIAIGVAWGILVSRLSSSDGLIRYQGGALVADGSLSRALNGQLSGQAPPDTPIRVAGTYRIRTGAYCRAFNISGPQTLGGLACRHRQQWQIQTLLNNAVPPSMLLDLNRTLNASAVTPVVEAQLRARDWQ